MLKKIIFKGYRRVQNISTPNKLSSRFMKQKTARVIRRNRNSLDVVSLNIPLLISFHSLWTLECVCVLVAQLCPTLCNPIDCTPPGPSVHGILQARTLEWVAISFSKRSYRKKESEVAQLCPTLSDPVDCSLPGSSIHGIFQARVLEWVAISFSRTLE